MKKTFILIFTMLIIAYLLIVLNGGKKYTSTTNTKNDSVFMFISYAAINYCGSSIYCNASIVATSKLTERELISHITKTVNCKNPVILGMYFFNSKKDLDYFESGNITDTTFVDCNGNKIFNKNCYL